VTSEEALVAVFEGLNNLEIPYMLTGSLASNHHGVSRSTKDADFVIETDERLDSLAGALGPSFRFEPQLSFATVTGTTRQIVQLVDTPFSIELFFLSADPHDRERFRRRQEATILGKRVWVATAEDVIVTKLHWSRHGKRTKDLDDAKNVIAVQAGRLDWDYIHRWCDEHGTRALLDEIRASLPPL
jgi:hypothetical protein